MAQEQPPRQAEPPRELPAGQHRGVAGNISTALEEAPALRAAGEALGWSIQDRSSAENGPTRRDVIDNVAAARGDVSAEDRIRRGYSDIDGDQLYPYSTVI